MTTGKLGPIELDACLNCSGIWFDCGELTRVIAAGPQIIRRLTERVSKSAGPKNPVTRTVGPPTCPGCRTPLSNVEYASMPGVRLDACGFCEGFWVARDSLEFLADSLEGASQWDKWVRPAAPAAAAQSPQPAKAPGASPAPPATPQGPFIPPVPPAARPPAVVPPGLARSVPGAAPQTAAAAASPQAGATPAQPTSRTPRVVDMEACPNCGEQNSPQAAVCWACSRPLQGKIVGKCPQCEASMREIVSENVTMSACEGCGGVWITPNRLNAVMLQSYEAHDKLLVQVHKTRKGLSRAFHAEMTCPYCNLVMFGRPLGMLTQKMAHNCPQCFGLFLPHGVMEDIILGQRR
jgi:Zn-finger nucleic acid-binding protein